MKIAAFVNQSQKIVSFNEKGCVCLFENHFGLWAKKKEISFEISSNMDLAQVKNTFKKVVSQLDDCRIFIIGESKGFLHVFLQDLGFSTWTSEGLLNEQLDNVAKKNTENTMAYEQLLINSKDKDSSTCGSCCHSYNNEKNIESHKEKCEGIINCETSPSPVFENIGDGYYRINLAEILQNNQGLNSKQILIPFFKKNQYQKLEILCDHIPKWFSGEAQHLNFKVASKEINVSGDGVKVILYPAN